MHIIITGLMEQLRRNSILLHAVKAERVCTRGGRMKKDIVETSSHPSHRVYAEKCTCFFSVEFEVWLGTRPSAVATSIECGWIPETPSTG